MDDYQERLRRLALHDETFLGVLLADRSAPSSSVLGSKTAALVRVAATIAVEAAPSSFQHAVAHALAAGARSDDGEAIEKGVEVVITRHEKGLVYVRTWAELAAEDAR